jgi:hypothetical protein
MFVIAFARLHAAKLVCTLSVAVGITSPLVVLAITVDEGLSVRPDDSGLVASAIESTNLFDQA